MMENPTAQARAAILDRVRRAIRAGAAPGAEALAQADAHMQARGGGPRPADSDWNLRERFEARALALSSSVEHRGGVAGGARRRCRLLARPGVADAGGVLAGTCSPAVV